MKKDKWSIVRLMGLIAAAVLIVFGSLENLGRAIRYGWDKMRRN